MRTCAPLYSAFAIESFANVVLFIGFMYLVLVIQSRGELETPGLAMLRFCRQAALQATKEVPMFMRLWEMQAEPLEKRFALCRKLNTMICLFTACVTLLATTRWLHIGNVNGFRYLGYAVTCPVMQAELVLMIAPVVPCYKLQVAFVGAITFATMAFGYAASLIPGGLWDADDPLQFVSSWDLHDLQPTTKLWVLLPSMAGITILTFIQLPYLAILYTCKGGVKADLPYNYRKLLLLVAVTWMAFPVWWLLNWQGMSVITDAKLYGAGFCLLNITSKGGFTYVVISSVRWHRRIAKTSSCDSQASKSGDRAAERSSLTSDGDCSWFVKLLIPFDSTNNMEEVWNCTDIATCAPAGEVEDLEGQEGITAQTPQCPSQRLWRHLSFEQERPSSPSQSLSRKLSFEQDVARLLNRVEFLCDALKVGDNGADLLWNALRVGNNSCVNPACVKSAIDGEPEYAHKPEYANVAMEGNVEKWEPWKDTGGNVHEEQPHTQVSFPCGPLTSKLEGPQPGLLNSAPLSFSL
jgi:hypothetical protein